MTKILSIDPGPTESGWVYVESAPFRLIECGVTPSAELLDVIRSGRLTPDALVIEKVQHFGMPAGEPIFQTVFWSGRFAEAMRHVPLTRIGQTAVRLHLCGTARAKESNVRTALLDRFGQNAKGTKKNPGPLFGIHSHAWAALALAVTYADTACPAGNDAPSWEEMADARAGGQA